jgi:hypothetical protein
VEGPGKGCGGEGDDAVVWYNHLFPCAETCDFRRNDKKKKREEKSAEKNHQNEKRALIQSDGRE